jgi:hypothetical protein
MNKVREFKKHLKSGQVYRREQLSAFTNAVDRYLEVLVADGSLQKLATGLYYCPERSVFGTVPPKEEVLVQSFLKDDDFLLTTPNLYNTLGVGTTQLYNTLVVYNHKRHGEFVLGNRKFDFRMKQRFPKKLSTEFLLVELVNNLEEVAEDKEEVLKKVEEKVRHGDRKKLLHAADKYGKVRTKKLFYHLLNVN